MKKFLLTLLFLSLLTNISFGLIKYIKPSASGIGDGSSWANASNDLQLIINTSNAGDTIWVAAGTYVPIRPSNQTNIIDLKNRNNAFILKPNINIFGSFLGNESTNFNLSNRDFANQSILSGDFNLDDVYDSTTDTIITGNSENAFHVLISTGNIGSVKIDGLTFKGGNGDVGGGLYITSSSPNFYNCNFLSNQANNNGGGGIWLSGTNATFTNCLIKGNESLFGAGIYDIGSTLQFLNCAFKNNVALKFDPNDGKGEAFGAGIITFGSNISIIDCGFDDNYANYGAAMVHFESTVVTKRTRFYNNKATSNGGAILSKKGTEQFINCQFISNSAKVGGALCTTNPNQNFINTTFLRNTATNNGGVVYNGFENELFPVIMNQIFTNCTFDSNNASSSGKLIFGFGFGYSFDNTVKFNNSIVWLNKNFSYSGNDLLSGSSINGFNAKYLLNNSVLQGSITSNIMLNSSSLGLLNVNPSLDFSFYIPKDNSVARNAGDNSLYTSAGGNLQTDLDLRSERRLISAIIDIGAFENQTSLTTTSSNADLANLTLSSGTLTPAFATGTTTYSASLSNATTSLTVTPTRAEANATITVNGVAVTSGSASGAIALNVGSNTLTTKVTAQDGTTTKTYTITVTRAAASSNADLASLGISSGTLSPAFAAGTTTYTASVSNATTSITVTPTRAEANATITVNGVAVTSGSASSAIALNVGNNTLTTVVTAQDGITKTYTITVARAASNNADLANLTLSSGTLTPAFAASTIAYTASVSNATTSVAITPTKSDANATITVNGVTVISGSASGAITLNVGNNTLNTIVTAQDGTIKTYAITITRAAASSNADLSSLSLSSGTLSPAFAAGTTSYTASVSNATTSITITPTRADANASITVNGVAVTSGSASGAIALNVGNNTISSIVTAQNGSTKTYVVIVSRANDTQCTPPTGGSITAPTNGCSDRVATVSVAGVSNATSYIWSIVGASSTKVTDTQYNIVYGSTNVTITVTPANGTNGSCTGTPITKTIIVSAAPDKPTISQTGTVLSANSSSPTPIFQWYLGSNMIVGATAATYSPTQNGAYTVESKNTNGCVTFSDPFTYFTTAINEDAKFKVFNFYPNPVESTLFTVFKEKYDLEFFDTSGRKILENKNLNGESQTDLSAFRKGIYIMKVTSGGKTAIRKIILK